VEERGAETGTEVNITKVPCPRKRGALGTTTLRPTKVCITTFVKIACLNKGKLSQNLRAKFSPPFRCINHLAWVNTKVG
jgi:hypothetical protein